MSETLKWALPADNWAIRLNRIWKNTYYIIWDVEWLHFQYKYKYMHTFHTMQLIYYNLAGMATRKNIFCSLSNYF